MVRDSLYDDITLVADYTFHLFGQSEASGGRKSENWSTRFNRGVTMLRKIQAAFYTGDVWLPVVGDRN